MERGEGREGRTEGIRHGKGDYEATGKGSGKTWEGKGVEGSEARKKETRDVRRRRKKPKRTREVKESK